MEPVSAIIAGIVVAVLGNAAGLLLWRSQKKKLQADATGILTTAAVGMVQRGEKRVLDLESAVEELRQRVRVLEDENECLRRGASRLEGQVESLGHAPVWRLRDLMIDIAP